MFSVLARLCDRRNSSMPPKPKLNLVGVDPRVVVVSLAQVERSSVAGRVRRSLDNASYLEVNPGKRGIMALSWCLGLVMQGYSTWFSDGENSTQDETLLWAPLLCGTERMGAQETGPLRREWLRKRIEPGHLSEFEVYLRCLHPRWG